MVLSGCCLMARGGGRLDSWIAGSFEQEKKKRFCGRAAVRSGQISPNHFRASCFI